VGVAFVSTLTPAIRSFAAEHLNLEHLDVSDQISYPQCRRNDFQGAVCGALLTKACTAPANKDTWTCLDKSFGECRTSDFADAACVAVLEKVCKATKNMYDGACDRHEYEKCLAADFKPVGCSATRIAYTLPILRAVIEGERRIERKIEPSREGEHEIIIDPRKFCSLAAGDRTSPLHAGCDDNGPMQLTPEDFLSAWNRATPAGFTRNAWEKRLLEGVLLHEGGTTRHEGLEILSVWMEIDERTRSDSTPLGRLSRELGARLLAKLGPDDLATTFLLLETGEDPLPGVRKSVMEGFKTRQYPSGLVIGYLVKGLSDDDASVRAAAAISVAARWERDAQSTFLQRDAQGKLSIFIDCSRFTAMSDPFEVIPTVDAFSSLDFSDPRILCSIGKGARLMRLKADLLGTFGRMARDASATAIERAAALDGLVLLSTTEAEQKQSAALARALLGNASDASLSLQAHAVYALALTTPKADKATGAALESFLRRLLEAPGSQSDTLVAVLAVASRQRHLVKQPAAGAADLGGLVKRNCISNSARAPEERIACFLAVANFEDVALENEIYPSLLGWIGNGSHQQRLMALDVFNSGEFRFMEPDGNNINCSARESYATALVGILVRDLKNQLGASAPFAKNLLDSVRRASITSDHARECKALPRAFDALIATTQSAPVNAWLEGVVSRNFPRLPIKAWYEAFTPENRVDVVEKIQVPVGQIPFPFPRGYTVRKDLRAIIPKMLLGRGFDDFLVRDHAWGVAKELYAISLALDTTSSVDGAIEKHLWGVSEL